MGRLSQKGNPLLPDSLVSKSIIFNGNIRNVSEIKEKMPATTFYTSIHLHGSPLRSQFLALSKEKKQTSKPITHHTHSPTSWINASRIILPEATLESSSNLKRAHHKI